MHAIKHAVLRQAVLALVVFNAIASLAGVQVAALAEQEAVPELKLAVPKFDKTPRTPLKGSVHHTVNIQPKKPAALSGQAASAAAKGNGLAGKASADSANLAKSKAKEDKADKLSAELQSGIGIIGVKFMMIFGRPPVINRVFPGTPAAEKGLRPNDIIIAVDGVPTFGLTKDEVYNMIVGTPRTPVTISFRRRNDFQVRTMDRMDFNEITDPVVRRDYQSM
jgi:C-terminal processing protease CtpA/Prc